MSHAAAEGWLEQTQRAYTLAIGVLTLAGAAWIAHWGSPGPAVQAGVMAAAVALIGLPHGAFDLELGRRALKPRLGRGWWVAFGGAYVALAALAAGLWWAVPSVGLGLLLIMGALHWGVEDLEAPPRSRPARWWFGVSRGAIPVALPCLAHPGDVAEVFAALGVEGIDGESIAKIAGAAVFAAIPGVAAGLWRTATHRSGRTLLLAVFELAVLTAWMIAASPLLAFTVYFCGWHAVRHSLRSAAEIDPLRPVRALGRYAHAAAMPTALSIAAALAFIAIAAGLDGEALRFDRWAQAVFVGLFALTVPHVLVESIPALHRGAEDARAAARAAERAGGTSQLSSTAAGPSS